MKYFIQMQPHDSHQGIYDPIRAQYLEIGDACCVVDYGEYSTQNICSCLEYLKVSYHIVHWEDAVSGYHKCDSPFCILSGGPLRVCERDNRYNLSGHIYGKRVMGICYGMQLLCWNAGAKILHLDKLQKGIIGHQSIDGIFSERAMTSGSRIVRGNTGSAINGEWWKEVEASRRPEGWYNRLDYVDYIPQNIEVLSADDFGLVSSCYIPQYNAYCIHSHPESPKCMDILLFVKFFDV